MHKPYLIQRCKLGNGRLVYDYMGMTEFEVGGQPKSLKRIFQQGLTQKEFSVSFADEKVPIFLVAGKDFDFIQYQPFLEVLANEDYHRPEPTRLKEAIERKLGKDQGKFADDTNAWFDFQNDVLLVLSKEDCDALVNVLEGIKLKWENPEPDSPALKKFKEELEVAKKKLEAAGKRWFALSTIREEEGEYFVWLNPWDQDIYNFGWFTIPDLLDWVDDKGCIVKKQAQK